jgi:hypothetical protein
MWTSFFRKALIVNTYYDRVSELYKSFRAGALSEAEALARKSELFAELEHACSAISPDPVSFNKCPAALNNAGLAFDRTYTRHYPLMYDLYISLAAIRRRSSGAEAVECPGGPRSVTSRGGPDEGG